MITTDMTQGVYRRIYSGMRTGRRINGVSIDAALAFWHLHAGADDFGNLLGCIDLVRSETAPRRREWTDDRFAELLAELAGTSPPLIAFYESNGERYIHICDWLNRQPANKSGRRIRRHPAWPGEQAESKGEQASGGILGSPGESGGIRGNPGERYGPESESENESENENENESENESDNDTGRRVAAGDCDSIYSSYPRKEGKRAAITAIGRAIKRITAGDDKPADAETWPPADPAAWLIERVRAFAKSPAGQAGQFTPQPATFFNQARYSDDAANWQRSNPNDGNDNPGRVRDGKYDDLF